MSTPFGRPGGSSTSSRRSGAVASTGSRTSFPHPQKQTVQDGFADESGEPVPQMPTTRAPVGLEETAAGTRMTVRSRFATVEQMEQLVRMGMVEGMTLAMGQIDRLLAGT